MSKYQPLSARLAAQAGTEWRASFAELEKLLGFPLPKSARARPWWKTGVWTEAGWTAEADPVSRKVTFRRAATAPASQPPAVADEPPILRRLDTGPGWGVALMLGGVAIVAGLGALAIRGVMRRRDD